MQVSVRPTPFSSTSSGSSSGSQTSDTKAESSQTSAASGSSDTDWSYIADKGSMTIGITYFEPMNYMENNKLTGFETDFATAVCEELGVTPDFQEIEWESKELELNAKTIDCIWNGLTITDERKENMDISIPYMENKQVMVVKSENVEKFSTAEGIKGASVVAESGSAGTNRIGCVCSGRAFHVSIWKRNSSVSFAGSPQSARRIFRYPLSRRMRPIQTPSAPLLPVPQQIRMSVSGPKRDASSSAAFREAVSMSSSDGIFMTSMA